MKFLKQLLVFIVLIGVVGCKKEVTPEVVIEDNQEFKEFLDKEFVESMEADYLSLHYTLEDYQKYGIEKPEPTLGEINLEVYSDAVEDAEASLKELEKFDLDSLSSNQKIDYLVYKNSLENYKVINSYPMFDDLFKPNGLSDNLITNLIEFDFRSVEDIEDYLKLLKTVAPYMEEAIKLTEEKAAKGYFISESAVDYVIEGIDRFISKVDDNELIVDFNNEMDKFAADNADDYKNTNKEIVINEIIPVYKKIKDSLNALRGTRSIDGGIALYEDGKAYFEALMKDKTSNKLGLEEQLKLAEKYIADEFVKIRDLNASDPEAFESDYYSKFKAFDDAEAVVKFVRENMSEHYPEGPDVQYEISYLDESIANESILAYYLNPPIDNVVKNIIKVNPKSAEQALEFYTTITHEGFPGHLFQITYFLSKNPHPIRSVISHIGYAEGWAMYTETMSTYFINEFTDSEAQLYNLDIKLNYVLSAAVDIGINGLGWSLEDTKEWLDSIGFGDVAESLYDYAVMMPGSLVPYGYGLLQFYQLREDAEKKLGNKFNEIEFNKVLLDNGDRYFEIVKEDVDKYINSVK